MQVTINRNNLLDWLSVVEKAIPSKAPFSAIDGVYMRIKGDGLVLCANNLEMAIRLFARGLESSGEGAVVLPRQFVQVIKQVPGNKVDITVKDNKAVVISGKSRFKLNCVSADEFPVVDNTYLDKPSFKIEGRLLKEMIAKTTFCVANSTANHIFQGVFISNDGGKLICLASDTHRLAWYEKIQINFLEPFGVIVPGKLIEDVGRIVNDNDNIKIYISDNRMVFVVNEYTISIMLLSGKYPDFSKIFPKKAATIINANKQTLIDVLSRARILTDNQNEMISLTISGDIFTVSAQSEAGKMSEELQVQVRGESLKQFFINVKYMLDGVKALDGNELHIKFNGDSGAVVMNDDAFKYLALPIKPNK